MTSFESFDNSSEEAGLIFWLSGYINTLGYVKYREDNPKVATIDGAYDYWRQGG